MLASGVLTDAFGRVHRIVHRVVEGLTPDDLSFRIDGETNSIAWLVWHLTRIQDDHVPMSQIPAKCGHRAVGPIDLTCPLKSPQPALATPEVTWRRFEWNRESC